MFLIRIMKNASNKAFNWMNETKRKFLILLRVASRALDRCDVSTLTQTLPLVLQTHITHIQAYMILLIRKNYFFLAQLFNYH